MMVSKDFLLNDDNDVVIPPNVTVTGRVRGRGNVVRIGTPSESRTSIRLDIHGCGNSVVIGDGFRAHGLIIQCGTHRAANRTTLKIGANFSIESGGRFLLHTSGNRCEIGDNCLFSSAVTIRCGEYPHMIFDLESGKFLDESDGVFIGDHVWVGERAYITKRASVPSECVVAAHAVVTKRFTDEHCAIGGNPAKVVRSGIQWIRNDTFLEPGSKFYASHEDFKNRMNHD